MNKKFLVILTAAAAILVIFGITWDVLQTTNIISSEFNTSPIISIGGACGVFAAILASQTVTKKKDDSDKK